MAFACGASAVAPRGHRSGRKAGWKEMFSPKDLQVSDVRHLAAPDSLARDSVVTRPRSPRPSRNLSTRARVSSFSDNSPRSGSTSPRSRRSSTGGSRASRPIACGVFWWPWARTSRSASGRGRVEGARDASRWWDRGGARQDRPRGRQRRRVPPRAYRCRTSDAWSTTGPLLVPIPRRFRDTTCSHHAESGILWTSPSDR